MSVPNPYPSDLDYFSHECRWLKVLAARIQVERDLREAKFLNEMGNDGPGNAKGLRTRRILLKEREEEIRREVDSRLEVHRRDPAFKELGLDKICRESRLKCPHERTLLLGLTASAVGYEFANEILGGIDSLFNGMTVGDLILLLNPQNVGDWLRGRAYFHKDAPLVRDGRVVLPDFAETHQNAKDGLLTTEAVLAPMTFELVTGVSLTAVASPADEIVQ